MQPRRALDGEARYAKPRTLIRWDADPQLAVIKMLAWAVWQAENPTARELFARVEELTPMAIEAVLQQPGVTFADLCERARQKFGAEITPAKLHQRADKTARYCEFNQYAIAVTEFYDAATASPAV
jgi:hypothetical protein